MAKTGSKPIDELIRLARIGDGHSFTALWDTYYSSLRSYLNVRMGISSTYYLDDICSRSFEKAFRQIMSFDPEKGEFFVWLKTIARNTALDVIKASNRMEKDRVSTMTEAENVEDDVDSPEEAVIKDEETVHLQNSIDALPPLYKEPARLFLLEHMPQKEIAERLELNYCTVRTRVDRAKKLLKAMDVTLDKNAE